MCMSCGCGEFNERHNPGDIVAEDLNRAAQSAGIDMEQVAENISKSVRKMKSSGQTRSAGQAG